MQVCLRHIQHHCKQLHIVDSGIKVHLVTAYATSHMLFGCMAWGHCFGVRFRLAGAISSVGKLAALHNATLCWALVVPSSMHGAALYLLAGTIPLQGHIKQQIPFFGRLEFERA